MFNPNKKTIVPPNESADTELAERFSNKLEQEKSLKFMDKLFEALPELEMYLVGGMVRDTIIKHPTSKDYDFIARGVPIEKLIAELKKLGRVVYKGRNFGVLIFKPEGSTLAEDIDIALPRTEEAEGTGGYKDVETTSDHTLPVEEDLARRDLTINAIAWNVREKEVIDPFDGQKDLENKTVRAVGEPTERIQEDYSRMLRALRFACRFGYDIEEKTWSAIKDKMSHINDKRELKVTEALERSLNLADKLEVIEKLTADLEKQRKEDPEAKKIEFVTPRETIAKELIKTFKENPARAMKLYDESGAFEMIMPEILDMKGCEQEKQYHSEGDVWEHTKMMMEKIGSPEFRKYFKGKHISGEFALGVLLHDVGKPGKRKVVMKDSKESAQFHGHDKESADIAEKLALELNLSAEQKERLMFMATNHMFAMSAKDVNDISASKFANKFIDSPYSQDLLMLFYLDSNSSIRPDGTPPMENFEATYERIKKIKEIRANQPKKILNGNKVFPIFNIKPNEIKKLGPFTGMVMGVVGEKANQGIINNEEEAVAYIEKHKSTFEKYKDKVNGDNRSEITEKLVKKLA